MRLSGVADKDIRDEDLRTLYLQWAAGRSKNDIERREWNDPYSHGKRFTGLVRKRLGQETEDIHPLVIENQRLRDLLVQAGIDPDS